MTELKPATTTPDGQDERCDSPKVQGSETIHCYLSPGHDRGPDEGDPGTWHEAVVTDHREMDFGSSRIWSDTREVISWEPASVKLRRGFAPLRRQIADREPAAAGSGEGNAHA
jgi:hypothetical protein